MLSSQRVWDVCNERGVYNRREEFIFVGIGTTKKHGFILLLFVSYIFCLNILFLFLISVYSMMIENSIADDIEPKENIEQP